MNRQFSGVTFFDLNIDNDTTKLLMPTFYQQNQGKKRLINNSIIVRYLKNENLSIEELEIAKKILTGQIFSLNKNKYGHCKLCSSSFNDYTIQNVSDNIWQVGMPTQPYTPFGLMIYLTDRASCHKGNFYDLSETEFYSLINHLVDLYNKISKSDFKYNVVGINTLFNQINVSQRCIHGHIEPMIHDIDKQGLGCTITTVDKNILDNTLRIKINNNYKEIISIVYDYIEETKNEINKIRGLQKKYLTNNTNEDIEKIKSISPAPTVNIYITYYRNYIYLSLVRDLYQDPILACDVDMKDSFIYNLKYNIYAVDNSCKLLFKKVPVVRPSIKVNDSVYQDIEEYNEDLNSLKRILSYDKD